MHAYVTISGHGFATLHIYSLGHIEPFLPGLAAIIWKSFTHNPNVDRAYEAVKHAL